MNTDRLSGCEPVVIMCAGNVVGKAPLAAEAIAMVRSGVGDGDGDADGDGDGDGDSGVKEEVCPGVGEARAALFAMVGDAAAGIAVAAAGTPTSIGIGDGDAALGLDSPGLLAGGATDTGHIEDTGPAIFDDCGEPTTTATATATQKSHTPNANTSKQLKQTTNQTAQ